MNEPWFSPEIGTYFGALAGGIGGALAGILGAVGGFLAPKGKGKSLVVGGMCFFFVFGVCSLAVGLAAVIQGQPYGIWYPFTLVGGLFAVIMGALLPVVLRSYRQADERRLRAEEFRNT